MGEIMLLRNEKTGEILTKPMGTKIEDVVSSTLYTVMTDPYVKVRVEMLSGPIRFRMSWRPSMLAELMFKIKDHDHIITVSDRKDLPLSLRQLKDMGSELYRDRAQRLSLV